MGEKRLRGASSVEAQPQNNAKISDKIISCLILKTNQPSREDTLLNYMISYRMNILKQITEIVTQYKISLTKLHQMAVIRI